MAWSAEETVEFARRLGQGAGVEELTEAFPGRTRDAITKKAARTREVQAAAPLVASQEGVTLTERGDTVSLTSVSETIRTIEDALAYGNIDPNLWEVVEAVVNARETGEDRVLLWQVKARLKRRASRVQCDAAAALFERFKEHKPNWKPPKVRNGANHLLELSLFDAHFGKYAWKEEVGSDYDVSIAETVFGNAIDDLIGKARPFKIEKVLLPIGNDFFQVDSWRNETTAGTRVDTDGRLARVWQAGCMSMVKAIERCLTVAPVDLLWVPGNHDFGTSFFLTSFLAAWFRDNPHVSIDSSPRPRKAYRYGTNLIGFTHGDKEKPDRLPALMATEWPQLWAETKVHEYHCGHFHKAKSTKWTDVDEFEGVRIRWLPSLCSSDFWHVQQGYSSRRCAEAYLWDKSDGYAGHLSVNARE